MCWQHTWERSSPQPTPPLRPSKQVSFWVLKDTGCSGFWLQLCRCYSSIYLHDLHCPFSKPLKALAGIATLPVVPSPLPRPPWPTPRSLFCPSPWLLFPPPGPLILTCTFSGSDAGRLRGNENQMDIVQKLPKWVWECGELSGMERSWNFSAIKWDLSPLYHSHCRQPFTLTETPFQ